MSGSYYFIIPIIAIIILVLVLYIVISSKNRKAKKEKSASIKSKNRASIIREANKRLSQNPRDAEALKSLADLYYQDENFDKARKAYEILLDLVATNRELDEFEVTLRYAISCLRTKKMKEAYKSFVIARSLNQQVFEVNYHLGYLEYLRKNFEKSAPLLSQARQLRSDHSDTLKYLGMSQFKLNRFDEAAATLRKGLEITPDDKEALFTLGQAYFELGQNDKAVQILTRLRADPETGPRAALYSGTINMKMHKFEEAVLDFEIGLRHEKMKDEVRLELKYRLANAYIQTKNIPEAIKYFEEVMRVNPAYRDVPAQLGKYRELSLNRNLQVYLLGSVSEFVTLCRKLCAIFFPDAKVKIIDISVQKSEYADLLAEVHTAQWEDLVLYRYIRSSNQIGDLALRDMYARVKDLKAGRGFCVSAGEYTETAHQFVEARLIDLIDKEQLVTRLNSLSGWSG